MSALIKLSQQIQDGILQLSPLEVLTVQHIRAFPKAERMKIFDLFHRFFMAKQHCGEICFDFRWLLTVEKEYEAMMDQEMDVLKEALGS